MHLGANLDFEIPADLKEWSEQHNQFLSDLREAVINNAEEYPFSEPQAWSLIAKHASPSWSTAYNSLVDIEMRLHELTRPETIPLGAIGLALGGEELDQVQEEYAHALAGFTIVDENLRQQEDLNKLLTAVMGHLSVVEQSLLTTRRAQEATKQFTAAVVPAQKSAQAPSLSSLFSRICNRVLKPAARRPALSPRMK